MSRDIAYEQYCEYGNTGNYSIHWKSSQCIVGLETLELTKAMKQDIERCLRKQLPNSDFYDDFFGSIEVNSCRCSYMFYNFFKKYKKYTNKNKKFMITVELEYTCYCSNYGSPGMTAIEYLFINWT